MFYVSLLALANLLHVSDEKLLKKEYIRLFEIDLI